MAWVILVRVGPKATWTHSHYAVNSAHTFGEGKINQHYSFKKRIRGAALEKKSKPALYVLNHDLIIMEEHSFVR